MYPWFIFIYNSDPDDRISTYSYKNDETLIRCDSKDYKISSENSKQDKEKKNGI